MSYLGLEIVTPADDSVTSAKIVDGAILNVDVNASAAIAQSKLSLDIANANINASAAIDATKIADGTVTSTEFQYINTLSSNAQTQIDTKGVGDALLGTAQTFTAGQRGGITTLTPAATVTPNMADSNNFTLTLDQNTEIANPTNDTAGQSGSIFIIQDGTGGWTVSWGTDWEFAGGTAPTMTTTASALDRVDYIIRTTSSIQAVATLNLS